MNDNEINVKVKVQIKYPWNKNEILNKSQNKELKVDVK